MGPAAGALIEPTEAITNSQEAYFSEAPGLEKLSVSDQQGNFEIVSEKECRSSSFIVSPRGFAPVLVSEPTGDTGQTVAVTPGATVMGRVVRKDGTPIANLEVAMSAFLTENGSEFSSIRIGTDNNGIFAFSNVPTNRVFRVYPTESLQRLNLTAKPLWLETTKDGQVVNVGRYTLAKGLKLIGRVEIASDAQIPKGLYVELDGGYQGENNTVAPVDEKGYFEFAALPSGPYALTLAGTQALPSPPKEVLLDRDRDDIRLNLPPVTRTASQP